MNGFEKHGVDHLSPSSLNLWINCPSRWVAQKVFGRKSPTSPAQARGHAVEGAVVAVVAHGQAVEDALAAELQRYDERFFIADEKVTKEREMIAPMVDQAIKVVAPLGIPEFPEADPETGRKQKQVGLICNCGDFKIPIIGFLDLFYPQHGRIIDLKSTQRMPSRMTVEHQLQRAIYARAVGNSSVEFLYVTPAKAALLADGDIASILQRVKWHVARLEAFLQLDREQIQAIVPVQDTSFYWSGSEAELEEIFAAPAA